MRIYFDASALSRLSDDKSQERIRLEAEAVEAIFRLVFLRRHLWVAALPLIREVGRNKNLQKRKDTLALIRYATLLPTPDQAVISRAHQLHTLGYGPFDSLHLAAAEAGRAAVLITTDDRLINRALRRVGEPSVEVVNPLEWLKR